MKEQKCGKIVKALSGFYYVRSGDTVIECRARGIFRREKITPLVGDEVEFSVERGKGTVERILPRRNSFLRPAVSNVDALVILCSGANPVTDPFLIDRVAAIAGDRNVPTLLCVNKLDLNEGKGSLRSIVTPDFPFSRRAPRRERAWRRCMRRLQARPLLSRGIPASGNPAY